MTSKDLEMKLNLDQGLIDREVPSQRVLGIQLQAPVSAGLNNRPRLNLALVLDRSGSMSGEKLSYVRKAARHAVSLLQDQDRVALVVYDDEVNLLSPSVQMTPENRSELTNRISRIHSGGSTNLSGGWLAGCQEVAAAAQDGMINRTLLLTDGLANAGITDLEALAQHARELSRRGVSTTTFGVGEGFNEHLLEAMSNQGGGNFYYIETPDEIPALFAREFKELAAVTMRDLEIAVEIPPHVNIQVLGGWRTEIRDDLLHIFVGNLFSGQTQEIFLKVLTPPANGASELSMVVLAHYLNEDGEVMENDDRAIFRYAGREEVAAAPQARDVLERFARIELAETANEALKLERVGKNTEAKRMLAGAVAACAPYVSPKETEQYRELSMEMETGMDEAGRKQAHYDNYNQRRNRSQ